MSYSRCHITSFWSFKKWMRMIRNFLLHTFEILTLVANFYNFRSIYAKLLGFISGIITTETQIRSSLLILSLLLNHSCSKRSLIISIYLTKFKKGVKNQGFIAPSLITSFTWYRKVQKCFIQCLTDDELFD